jgi:hypothetical protein
MKDDYVTNSISGAEAYEKARGKYIELKEPDFNEDEDELYEDECNCSDPGCPCGGIKRGCL